MFSAAVPVSSSLRQINGEHYSRPFFEQCKNKRNRDGVKPRLNQGMKAFGSKSKETKNGYAKIPLIVNRADEFCFQCNSVKDWRLSHMAEITRKRVGELQRGVFKILLD